MGDMLIRADSRTEGQTYGRSEKKNCDDEGMMRFSRLSKGAYMEKNRMCKYIYLVPLQATIQRVIFFAVISP